MLPAAERANPYWAVQDAATGKALSPRAYSTGLTQDEAVRRIVTVFRKAKADGAGADVFFIAGTGSGKSLVALNVAARVGGRALIAIPTVNLQDQYEEAALSKRVLKPGGGFLSVASVKGKRRYECEHEGGTAAEPHVCSRSSKNKDARWRKAAECPYWAPTMTREGYDALLRNRNDLASSEPLSPRALAFLESLEDKSKSYVSIEGQEFVHVGPRGCGYFDAHYAFAAADVVLLSNRKWQIETDLGRKPKTDLEVFDEADGFLDELFEEQRLTTEGLEALAARIAYAACVLTLPESTLRSPDAMKQAEPDARALPDPEGWLALSSLVRRLRTFASPKDFEDEKTWKALEAAPRMLSELPKLARERLRADFANRPWATLHVENLLVSGAIQDEDENIVAKVKAFTESKEDLILAYDATGVYFTYKNLAAPLRKLTSRCAPLRLWMSATFPSAGILRTVYGFRDPVIVQGEPRFQGTLRVAKSDVPRVTHTTWQQAATRKAFAAALDDVFRRIPDGERTIVVVHGKSRILEIADVSPVARWIAGEIEDDALRHEQRLEEFMRGERVAIASTRIARGVDFADDRARNVVLIKDPLPNLKSRRFQVLEKKWSPELLFAYADDIASRQLAQMVGRGLRNENDWVRLWALDSAIFSRLARVTDGRATVREEAPPPIARSMADVVARLPKAPLPPPVPKKKRDDEGDAGGDAPKRRRRAAR